jgi:hypothetical protein
MRVITFHPISSEALLYVSRLVSRFIESDSDSSTSTSKLTALSLALETNLCTPDTLEKIPEAWGIWEQLIMRERRPPGLEHVEIGLFPASTPAPAVGSFFREAMPRFYASHDGPRGSCNACRYQAMLRLGASGWF